MGNSHTITDFKRYITMMSDKLKITGVEAKGQRRRSEACESRNQEIEQNIQEDTFFIDHF